MPVKLKDISGQDIGGTSPIDAGALQEATVQTPDNVENTDAFVFTANIDQAYVFPASLADSMLLVGIAMEVDSETTNDSLTSNAIWNHGVQGAIALNQRKTVFAGPASGKHQRVTWFDLASPPSGSGDVEITFNTEANILDGTIVIVALSDINQVGPDVTAEYSNPSSETATASFTPTYENSLVFTICSHAWDVGDAGPWSPQTGQTVIVSADGDAGETTNQNAASGYRQLTTIQEYTETWNHLNGSPLRSAMSLVVYSAAQTPQVYIPESLSYSKIRHLRT